MEAEIRRDITFSAADWGDGCGPFSKDGNFSAVVSESGEGIWIMAGHQTIDLPSFDGEAIDADHAEMFAHMLLAAAAEQRKIERAEQDG